MCHSGSNMPYAPHASCALLLAATVSSALHAAPQSGDIYREYTHHASGNLEWRVTDEAATEEFPRAAEFLPNPQLTLTIDELEHAVRAEAIIDRWGGHRGTINKRLRFNDGSWITIPEITGTPDDIRPEQLMFQDNPVVEIPLEDLVEGENTFVGDCDETGGFGWGQWGLYAIKLRVYYDADALAERCDFDVAITSPASAATITDNPLITVQAESRNGVSRIDLLAYYDGYDFDGDGRFTEWQESHFQLTRGQPANIRDHVGTLCAQPYQHIWNTHWVPDQQPGSIQLIARVQDAFGYWTVTEPITDLTLHRDDVSVKLYPATDVPEDFDVRVDETKSCNLPINRNHDLSNAIEAAVHLRTWHGDSRDHSPIRINDHSFPADGKNHHFDYDLIPIPTACLRTGENDFIIHSATEHHMLEILWPGPALVVKYRK